jgi:RNA polymerase sigma factor (sigma-70 family)
MLQNLGPARFQQLAAEINENGVRDVLNRDSTEGPDFFRAVDMVKKRVLREKSLASLDDQGDVAIAAGSDGAAENRRGALREAIARSLNPREAELIQATLQGFSPAEIASRWGVAPKTVSNEKTRALSKLRAVLSPDLLD